MDLGKLTADYVAKIQSTCASNRIEGIYTTDERTLAELIASGFNEKVGVGRSTAYVKK